MPKFESLYADFFTNKVIRPSARKTGEENSILELPTAVGVGKETGSLARILTSALGFEG